MTDIVTVPPENRSSLEAVSQARQALSQARTVPEMKRIRSFAEALALIAFREGYVELQQQSTILMLEAERTLGRWLKDNVNHNGGNPNWSDYQGLPEGITKKQSHHFQLEASLPESKFRSWLASCLAEEKEISAGILRKIAKAHKDGDDPVDELIPSFDTMKTRVVYWVGLIIKHYPARFPDLLNEIIKLRRGEWK